MTTQDLKNLFAEVKVNEENNTKEYKLMYYYGVWYVSEKIFAENDAEAIFDADRAGRIANDRLNYRLVCGNRVVKNYPNANGMNNII